LIHTIHIHAQLSVAMPRHEQRGVGQFQAADGKTFLPFSFIECLQSGLYVSDDCLERRRLHDG
jgi:hypothetical protein